MDNAAVASALGTVAVSALQIYQFFFGLIGAWYYATMGREVGREVEQNTKRAMSEQAPRT
jgi:hypothetical protein